MKIIEAEITKFERSDYKYARNGMPRNKVFVSLKGENIWENLQNRHFRPHKEYSKIIKATFKAAGLRVPSLTWSQKAGCGCGCSPGFIMKGYPECAGNIHLTIGE